jgi:hypothetical protein
MSARIGNAAAASGVSDRKASGAAVENSALLLGVGVVQAVDMPSLVHQRNLTIRLANGAFLTTYGLKRSEFELHPLRWRTEAARSASRSFSMKTTFTTSLRPLADSKIRRIKSFPLHRWEGPYRRR